MIYELWYSLSTDSYSFFPINNNSARKLLESDAVIIQCIEAENWEEACRFQHKYLGWEDYKKVE